MVTIILVNCDTQIPDTNDGIIIIVAILYNNHVIYL